MVIYQNIYEHFDEDDVDDSEDSVHSEDDGRMKKKKTLKI